MLTIDVRRDERVGRLLGGLLIPRPVGWVTTLDRDGNRNLAPFSFFNLVSYTPPLIMLSISDRDGEPKDTLRNILDTGELVAHIPDVSLLEQVSVSSGEFARDVDEIALTKLGTVPSAVVAPPRLVAAPVALEAKLVQQLPLDRSKYVMLIAEVVYIHLREDLLNEQGNVDPRALNPLVRLGNGGFASLGEIF